MLKKPEESEYAEFQQKYIQRVPEAVIPHLSTQKTRLEAYLNSLSDDQLSFRYAENKWSIREVIMHIIDTEIIFNYRALSTCRGEKQNLPGFNQDEFVIPEVMNHYSKDYLAKHFQATRNASLTLFEGILDSQWMQVGNMSSYTMTLRSFPFMLAGHFDHHMEILENRYKS